MFSDILRNGAALVASKPLMVLFDETDVFVGETLISFLRQLRGSFAVRRPGTFPVSIAFVGMRDLRDYITADKGGIALTPRASALKILRDQSPQVPVETVE
jgi:hypothetical protein